MTDFSVTVLITRQEYAAFAHAATKRTGFTAFFAAGAVCLLAGGAVYLLEQPTAMSLGLWLMGAVLCLWDGVVAPLLAQAAAGREYDGLYAGRMAQTLVFSDGSVRVSTPHAEGTVPLSAITRVTVSRTGVQLDFGRELSLLIPERSVTAEQLAWLGGLAKEYAKMA